MNRPATRSYSRSSPQEYEIKPEPEPVEEREACFFREDPFDDTDEDSVDDEHSPSWRMQVRVKTASVALVLCLNIGTDPPDVERTSAGPKHQCWIDPESLNPRKAMDAIGCALQRQYERWQPRVKYKQQHDPTASQVKKLCYAQRKAAKSQRMLFHYNGHGVPRPTENGEIWVFNKNYTQYIPLSVYDLTGWVRFPAIYVFDCPSTGTLLQHFYSIIESHFPKHNGPQVPGTPGPNGAAGPAGPGPQGTRPGQHAHNRNASYDELPCIVLGSCGVGQNLPMHPKLPADLLTACLTTPIKTALHWFVVRNNLDIDTEVIDKIPGGHNDRKSLFGELNWIFTSITDTIAWTSMPHALFKQLYRQDLLLASIFRNFLLAIRIFRTLGATPVSIPELPPAIATHPLWLSWDLTVEQCLARAQQLHFTAPFQRNPQVLPSGKSDDGVGENESMIRTRTDIARENLKRIEAKKPASTFFEDQLTAFEVWLEHGPSSKQAPVQLCIVLQVLLSQLHRLRALKLLAEFLDLGDWATEMSLAVGIHAYVQKLLVSASAGLQPVLTFIWSKVVQFDSSCCKQLVQKRRQEYFHARMESFLKKPALRAAFAERLRAPAVKRIGRNARASSINSAGTHATNISNRHNRKARAASMNSAGGRNDSVESTDSVHAALRPGEVSGGQAPSERAAEAYAMVEQQMFCRSIYILSLLMHHQPQSRSVGFVECALDYFEQLDELEAHLFRDNMAAAGQEEQIDSTKYFENGLAAGFSGGTTTFERTQSKRSDSELISLRVWLCLGISQCLGDDFLNAQQLLLENHNYQALTNLLKNHSPEVRRAAVFALGHLIHSTYPNNYDAYTHHGSRFGDTQQAAADPQPSNVAWSQQSSANSRGVTPSLAGLVVTLEMLGASRDGHHSVRAELVLALARLVLDSTHVGNFFKVVSEIIASKRENVEAQGNNAPSGRNNRPDSPSYNDVLGGTPTTSIRSTNSIPASRCGSRKPMNASASLKLLFSSRHRSFSDDEVYAMVWAILKQLHKSDPFPRVKDLATRLVRYIMTEVEFPSHQKRSPSRDLGSISSVPLHQGGRAASVRVAAPGTLSSILANSGSAGNLAGMNLPKTGLAGSLGATSSKQQNQSMRERMLSSKAAKRSGPGGIFSRFRAKNQEAASSMPSGQLAVDNDSTEDLAAMQALTYGDDFNQYVPGENYNVNDVLDAVGLVSRLFQEQARRYAKPQLQRFDPESDPMSARGAMHRWQLVRNAGVVLTAENLGAPQKFVQSGVLDTKSKMTSALLFHPFETVLVAVDEQNVVNFWNYEAGSKISALDNGNGPNGASCRTTALAWMNPNHNSLLVTATDDGVAKVWRSPCQGAELTAAWKAMPSMTPGGSGAGMVMEWQQPNGYLITGGRSHSVAIWDVGVQRVCRKFKIPAHSGVTKISTISDDSNIIACGYANGTMHLLDLRMQSPLVTSMKSHHNWVVDIHRQKQSKELLVSASVDGEIKIWDVRSGYNKTGLLKNITLKRVPNDYAITAFASHDYSPIFASGSNKEEIRVFNDNEDQLCHIRYHDGFLGQRIGRVASLAFHQHKMYLAAGFTDNFVSIYTDRHKSKTGRHDK